MCKGPTLTLPSLARGEGDYDVPTYPHPWSQARRLTAMREAVTPPSMRSGEGAGGASARPDAQPFSPSGMNM